jgi:AcrR family transcriptional regulator
VTSNPERREQTRSAILAAAAECFVEFGFAAATLSEVQTRAKVSRGALYHHFASKESVMEAVFERASADAVTKAREAALSPTRHSGGPLAALTSGCVAWLEFVTRSPLGVVIVQEGPAAIGWDRARAIEEQHSLGLMQLGLRQASAAGEISVPTIELAARLINAMLAEAASFVLAQPEHRRRAAEKAATKLIITTLDGYRVSGAV